MSKSTRRPSGLLVPAYVYLGRPRAVHCKRERHHVYIGRPSKWGNPFVVGKHGQRGECIGLYESWLRENAALFAALDELRGIGARVLVRAARLPRRTVGAVGEREHGAARALAGARGVSGCSEIQVG